LGCCYFLMRYRKIDGEILRAAAELIPEAEELFLDREKSGEEKMRWVTTQISGMIPGVMTWLFSEEHIEKAIQFIFDRICAFVKVK